MIKFIFSQKNESHFDNQISCTHPFPALDITIEAVVVIIDDKPQITTQTWKLVFSSVMRGKSSCAERRRISFSESKFMCFCFNSSLQVPCGCSDGTSENEKNPDENSNDEFCEQDTG